MDAHSDKAYSLEIDCSKVSSSPSFAQIWALAVHENEEEFITGGSDGVMNVWADKTAVLAEEKNRNLENTILQYVL